jgi:hypothetical protein
MNETLDEASKPESAAVEPVAWMYTNRVGNHYCTMNRHPEWTSNGSTETPLIPATALTALTERVERLEGENARLREALDKARQPTWFYDINEPERCLYSPEEVVDFMDPAPGKHVFEVECATSLPSIWCMVEVLTDEQMDERETDDRFIIREFATEAEARAALKETASEAEPKPASCPSSPTGRCIVDSTMESGPNNCFHCERPMRWHGAKNEN